MGRGSLHVWEGLPLVLRRSRNGQVGTGECSGLSGPLKTEAGIRGRTREGSELADTLLLLLAGRPSRTADDK